MFFGSQCLACDSPGPRLCATCGDDLEPARPFDAPDGLTSCTALLDYHGVARQLVVALKYRNARGLIHRAAAALAAELVARDIAAHIDVVTWAPTGGARRRSRGYDQAELLGHDVARALGRPAAVLLRRLAGPAQTGQSRQDRLLGPGFSALSAVSPAPTVLVVDDVLTTGATLTAAAAALHQSGWNLVHGAVLAHTVSRVANR